MAIAGTWAFLVDRGLTAQAPLAHRVAAPSGALRPPTAQAVSAR